MSIDINYVINIDYHRLIDWISDDRFLSIKYAGYLYIGFVCFMYCLRIIQIFRLLNHTKVAEDLYL
jgi:hypothetical protein